MANIQEIITKIIRVGGLVKIMRAGTSDAQDRVVDFLVILVRADGQEFRCRRPFLVDALIEVANEAGI